MRIKGVTVSLVGDNIDAQISVINQPYYQIIDQLGVQLTSEL